jgi:hypothetical protein
LCPFITTSSGLPRNVFNTGKNLNFFLWVAMKFHTNFTNIHKTVTLPVFYAEASWTQYHQENSNAYKNISSSSLCGASRIHLAHCSFSRLIVLNPALVPPFISKGAPRQTAWETSISERRNYRQEMPEL